MARVWQVQTSFNRGELDPRLVGRKDLQAYYSGARVAQNVVTLIQGGLRRRNGTKFIYSDTDGRIFNFSFSTSVNYALLFTDLQIRVFKNGVSQATIVSPYTLAQVKQIDYIQSADTALIFHPDVQSQELSRTSDIAWSIGGITFVNQPQYDFNDTDSPAPTSAVQRITFGNYREGDRYKVSLEGVLSDEIAFAGDDATNSDNIRVAMTDMINTAGEGTITVANTTSPNVFSVTLSGGSAKDWDLLTVVPTNTADAQFQGLVTELTAGVSRAEDVWSTARGWPSVATFHEARLWLGGTNFRPATIWGSKVNFFFDFKAGKARDDEGIDVTLDTDQVNAVTALFSNRTLQVFTSGGEFSVGTSPITPANIAVLPQTNYGTKRVRPVTVDGLTLFIQRTGKSIRNFFFSDDSKSYDSASVSVLASHLVANPTAMAVSRGTSEVDANYVYIVNDDGTMVVYNSMISEDVQGFTRWVTDGLQQSIAVVDDLLYTYTKRTINGADVYFLECEDPALTTDASATASSTNTLTGLAHLNGATIDVIADGAYMGEFVVSGGEVIINRQATLITGGLNFTPIIESMPLNIPLQNGPNAALPKRIVRAGIELFESNGALVNGQRIADKTMGVDVFSSPSPKTGLESMFLQGWSVEATLTITQDEPVPLTVLAAYLEVSV